MIRHLLGLDDPNSPVYMFYSGVGGSNLPMLVGVLAFLRKHNCHVHRCPRLGRHPVEGTAYVVCRKHHPEDAPTPGCL